ncbi:MAG: acyl-CoA reductase [Candidatus Latescibacterota bacterium]
MIESACHLPGLDLRSIEWETLHFNQSKQDLKINVPVLKSGDVKALTEHVRNHNKQSLAAYPVKRIVEIIDEAVNRLLDRKDPYRQQMEHLLPLITGYDQEMLRLGLTQYLKSFRKTELQRFLAEDFSNPSILDEFQPLTKGGHGLAVGPEICAHIWAGNVPGLPLWSIISGLLVKSGTIGKVPSAEPMFATWFARLLSEIEPELADCIAIAWWKGGDEDAETALLEEADIALAYGSNEALTAIQARTPITTRLLTYGHKVSFSLIGREALDAAKASSTARLAAYDVARYDQQGCYSPQIIFIEKGGSIAPRQFTQYLAHELEALEHKFPRRRLSFPETSSVAAWRNAEELAADADVIGDKDGAWSVSYLEDKDGFKPSGLNRTIRVVAVDDLQDISKRVAPYKRLLQTVGVAVSPQRLLTLSKSLGAAGITRISALGDMTAPEAGWHHDGRFNLSDLVRIVEIDSRAFPAADRLAPYAD